MTNIAFAAYVVIFSGAVGLAMSSITYIFFFFWIHLGKDLLEGTASEQGNSNRENLGLVHEQHVMSNGIKNKFIFSLTSH